MNKLGILWIIEFENPKKTKKKNINRQDMESFNLLFKVNTWYKNVTFNKNPCIHGGYVFFSGKPKLNFLTIFALKTQKIN